MSLWLSPGNGAAAVLGPPPTGISVAAVAVIALVEVADAVLF